MVGSASAPLRNHDQLEISELIHEFCAVSSIEQRCQMLFSAHESLEEAPESPRILWEEATTKASLVAGMKSIKIHLISFMHLVKALCWQCWAKNCRTHLHCPLPPEPLGMSDSETRQNSKENQASSPPLGWQNPFEWLVCSQLIFQEPIWHKLLQILPCSEISPAESYLQAST